MKSFGSADALICDIFAPSMKLGLRNAIFLAVILVIAVLPRLYRLTATQMLDFHSWRQGDSAAFVRGYIQNNLRLFDPRADRQPCAFAKAPFGQVESELPIPSFLTAVPLWLAGVTYPEPWTIRLASILFFLGACLYLYGLVLRFSGLPSYALASLSVLILSPLSIFFSRSPQPDGPALMFSLAFFYHFDCYLTKSRVRDLLLGVLFLAVLLLSKISNLFILLPALGLAISRIGLLGLFKRGSLWGGLGLAFLPTVGWYYYAQRFAWTFGIWGEHSKKWTNVGVFTNFETWRVLSERLTFEIIGWPGIVLAAIGFLAVSEARALTLSWLWASAVLIFFAATLQASLTHVYYQLPLVVPFSIAAGYGIIAVFRRGWYGRLALAALLALQLLLCWHRLWGNPVRGFSPYFAEDLVAGEGAALIRNHIPAKRFVSTDRNPSLFYNSDRQGFFTANSSVSAVLDCLRDGQTEYLLVDRAVETSWTYSERDWFIAKMQLVAQGIHYSAYRAKVGLVPSGEASIR
jgi:hypothetical protein